MKAGPVGAFPRPGPGANGHGAPRLFAGTAPPRRRARGVRYSRFVSLMRVLLPSIAVGFAGLIVVWPNLQATDERFQLGFSSLTGNTLEASSMVNARYYGTDNDAQPYTITADLASEAKPGSGLVDLSVPKADITLKDGAWLVLGADSGRYDHDSAHLDLTGHVNLFHDGGYEMHTAAARIDLQAGSVDGGSAVSGHGPFGEVEAEGFQLTERGKRLQLTGRSRLVVVPGREGSS